MHPMRRLIAILNEAEPKLNLVQILVLSKLIPNGSIPARVGDACGIHYKSAAGWALSRLKALEAKGLIIRRAPNDLYFTATEAGLATYEAHKDELAAAGAYLPAHKGFANLLNK